MRMVRQFKLATYQQITWVLVANLSPQSITRHNWRPKDAHINRDPASIDSPGYNSWCLIQSVKVEVTARCSAAGNG